MFDVIVIGLGAMGSAAACHLAGRRLCVLGLEQYAPAHANGSSHGDSRIIRQAYHESPEYVPLVQRAYELWRALEKDTETDLLHLTGGLMIGHTNSPIVEGAIRSAIDHNLPYELIDSVELRRRFPVLNPRADDVGVYERNAGFLRPEMSIRAHLQQASRYGAELHFEEMVEKWTVDSSGQHVRVMTDKATYEAGRLVITAGAWASEVLSGLNLPLQVQRRVMCWFKPLFGFESFRPEIFPIYLWDVDGHDVFYGFPVTDAGRAVKVAMHSGGENCSPSTILRQISSQDVEEVRRYLVEFVPSLNGPLEKAETCMYTLTPDEHFIVSAHPLYPQVAIAAGFSGHGFKFSSVMGEILADLAIEGRTKHSIEFLSPSRFEFGTP